MIWLPLILIWGSWFYFYSWYAALGMVAGTIFLTDYFCLRVHGFGFEVLWK